jgi:hypothetical protein
VGHRELTLRSDRNEEFGETIHVRFLDVLGMQTRYRYARLLIAEAVDAPSINRFVDVPARHSDRYLRLTVSDGAHQGFVVCAVLDVSSGPPLP